MSENATRSFQSFTVVGMAIDPVHVGTGGARLGRVDLSIVRDPVTGVPKIPGSSLAGVCRAYAAMAQEKEDPYRQVNRDRKPYYPDCAGQGQRDETGRGGHCGRPDCPICTVFGFARGAGGGFAGLAAFSDAHVLFFPVATWEGPTWVTCPDALRRIEHDIKGELANACYQQNGGTKPLNLGWLLLKRESALPDGDSWPTSIGKILPNYITQRVVIVSDKLFRHIVNSNLEVRTSVSIDPETGAAEEGALFSYEALPRATVLVWDVVCKDPRHFNPGGQEVSAQIKGEKIADPAKVFEVIKTAHPYLKALGIGGMGKRGMGRLQVLSDGTEQPDMQQPAEAQATRGRTS